MPEQFQDYTVYGPYVGNDGRSRVILRKNGKNKTMSYPKFLWWKHKGILISDEQHIHHKDENFSNNNIDNFEIKTIHDHMSLHRKEGAFHRTYAEYICPSCSSSFKKLLRFVRSNQLQQHKSGPYCSRSCAGRANQKYQQTHRKPGIPNVRTKQGPFRKLALKLYKHRQNGPVV